MWQAVAFKWHLIFSHAGGEVLGMRILVCRWVHHFRLNYLNISDWQINSWTVVSIQLCFFRADLYQKCPNTATCWVSWVCFMSPWLSSQVKESYLQHLKKLASGLMCLSISLMWLLVWSRVMTFDRYIDVFSDKIVKSPYYSISIFPQDKCHYLKDRGIVCWRHIDLHLARK